MLRVDGGGGFVREPVSIVGLVRGRFAFVSGRRVFDGRWRQGALSRLLERQRVVPVDVAHDGRRTYWAFADRIYWEDEELDPDDVRALVRERQRRNERRLERAHALAAAGDADVANGPRPALTRELKLAVWRRCAGRCTDCGSGELLEFDHVIPLALGGSSTENNLQLLCADCNRLKGGGL